MEGLAVDKGSEHLALVGAALWEVKGTAEVCVDA